VGPPRTLAPSLNVIAPTVTALPPDVTAPVKVNAPVELTVKVFVVAVVMFGEETTLLITTLSNATPQVSPGRTSEQMPPESCVNSHRSCAVLPPIPGSLRRTCWTPLERPPQA